MRKLLLLFVLLTAIKSSAQKVILSENFSGAGVPNLPSGWSMTYTSGGFAPQGWTVNDTSNALYDRYIPVKPAHNKYALVDEWHWPFNQKAQMTSPAISLSGTTHPYLTYDWFYLEGDNGNGKSNDEKAWINISTNGGSSWTTIDTFRTSNSKWQKKYFDLTAYAGNSNVKLQFVYTDATTLASPGHMYGIALDNISVFDAPANDLAVIAVSPAAEDPATDFFKTGSNVSFGGTVFNRGTSTVSSFTAYYQVGNGTPVQATISGLNIAPFSSQTFNISTPYAVSTVGLFPVKVWVKLASDTNVNNDTLSTRIYGYNQKPHKNVFFEEGTGTWCGYCVRGIVYMDSLWKLYDTSVNIVAVHSQNDPMDSENHFTVNYAEFLAKPIRSAYPSVYGDRRVVQDPSNVFSMYNQLATDFGLAEVKITNMLLLDNSLSVKASVKPATDLQGDYRLELILTEDKVHGTNDAYDQTNYYSFQDDNVPLSGVGYNFQDSIKKIPFTSMYYRYVARSTTPDMQDAPNGVAGSLPATMSNGSTYTYTFNNVDISQRWIQKNLTMIVLLINNDNGYVYNSARTNVSLSVPGLNVASSELKLYPVPARDILHVAVNADKSETYTIKVFDQLGRTVYNTQKQLQEGYQQFAMPLSGWPQGTYHLQLQAADLDVSKAFTIIK